MTSRTAFDSKGLKRGNTGIIKPWKVQLERPLVLEAFFLPTNALCLGLSSNLKLQKPQYQGVSTASNAQKNRRLIKRR